jgi:hypothetical protein
MSAQSHVLGATLLSWFFRSTIRTRFRRRHTLPPSRFSCRTRRPHLRLLLPLKPRLQIQRRPIPILNLVSPNMIQRGLHNRAKPTQIILLLVRKPRPIHHQNRLKPRIRLRLPLHRKLRRTRHRILLRNRRWRRRRSRILRGRLPTKRCCRDCSRRNRRRHNRRHRRRHHRPPRKLPPRNRNSRLHLSRINVAARRRHRLVRHRIPF